MSLKRIKIGKRQVVLGFFGVLLMLQFLKYGIGINIPGECLLVTALIIAGIGNNEEILALCMCCIPLYSSLSYLTVVLFSIIMFVFKNINNMKVSYTYLAFMILWAWEILHCFGDGASFKYIVILIVPWLLLLILHSYKENDYDYYYIMRMFAVFVLGVGVTLLTRSVSASRGNFFYAISNLGRLGLVKETGEITGGVINPNSFGIMCVFAITGLIQTFIYGKKKFTDIWVILFLIMVGTMTLSRTYLVCLCVMFMLFVFSRKDNIRQNLKLIIGTCVVLGIGFVVLYVYFPDLIQSYLLRWKVSDLTNGRADIFNTVIQYIWNTPSCYMFGIGFSDFTNKALEIVTVAPHDAFNELIMAWGLPGLAMFIGICVSVAVGIKRKNTNLILVNYIPIIIIIIKAIAGHLITSSYSILAFSLAYLSLTQDFSKNK